MWECRVCSSERTEKGTTHGWFARQNLSFQDSSLDDHSGHHSRILMGHLNLRIQKCFLRKTPLLLETDIQCKMDAIVRSSRALHCSLDHLPANGRKATWKQLRGTILPVVELEDKAAGITSWRNRVPSIITVEPSHPKPWNYKSGKLWRSGCITKWFLPGSQKGRSCADAGRNILKHACLHCIRLTHSGIVCKQPIMLCRREYDDSEIRLFFLFKSEPCQSV